MKNSLLSILITIVLCSIASAAEQSIGSRLQGRWLALEATSNGEAPPAGMLERLTLRFVGDKVEIMGAPLTSYRIDDSKKPAHIDILNSKQQVGILEINGDELRLCFGQKSDRPTQFRTKPYTDHTFIRLVREKP